MAEKIIKPKKFTKEWYGYIWDYYKAHILIGIGALIFISILAFNMLTSVKFDTNINFVATTVLSAEKSEQLSKACSLNSDDLNENGRVDIAINQLNFTKENKENSEMNQALLEKLMVLLNSTDELLFVVDEQMLPQVALTQYSADIFYKVSEWNGEQIKTDNEYAMSLCDSTILKELGIDGTDLYVLVAKTDADAGFKPEEENAIKIAKFLSK